MYNNEVGFIANNMDTELEVLLSKINEIEGTEYTLDEFKNTSNYVIAYMVAQRNIELQQSISVVYDYYKNYINIVNQQINNPISNINGVIDYFTRNGYNMSYRAVEDPRPAYNRLQDLLDPMKETGGSLVAGDIIDILNDIEKIKNSAGNIYIAVERADGLEWNDELDSPQVAKLILDVIDLGNILWGEKEQAVILTNGREEIIRFKNPVYEELKLSLTLTISNNYKGAKLNDDELKDLLVKKCAEYCKLGMDFEPQRILCRERDGLMYASEILLEWSTEDDPQEMDWHKEVKRNDFDLKEVIKKENITIIG